MTSKKLLQKLNRTDDRVTKNFTFVKGGRKHPAPALSEASPAPQPETPKRGRKAKNHEAD